MKMIITLLLYVDNSIDWCWMDDFISFDQCLILISTLSSVSFSQYLFYLFYSNRHGWKLFLITLRGDIAQCKTENQINIIIK